MPTTRAMPIEPHPVHGGWRIARTDWVYDGREEAWDCDYDFVTPNLYPSYAECMLAIAGLRAALGTVKQHDGAPVDALLDDAPRAPGKAPSDGDPGAVDVHNQRP